MCAVFLSIICTVQPLWSFWTGSDNTGECISGQRASILGSYNVPFNSAGEFICAERCIVGFY